MTLKCASCGAANPEAAELCAECGLPVVELTEGKLVNGRYRIQATLGRGGMGAVYKVLDEDLDEIVALKVLRADVAGTPGAEKRFRSEIKLARRISHPNVCRIFEFGRQGALSYLTMEFVDGVDLRGLLRKDGPLSLARALEVGIGVCHALEAIHGAGIIHRDLKAANIMMGQSGLKLMDFGIAKSTDSVEASATATGAIVGSPEYMSPEQVRAERLDARSDIYALGIVLYELFTGEPPLRGTTAVETLFKQLNEPAPLDPGADPRLPVAIVPILEKALAKPREARFSSAGEMRLALEALRDRAAAETKAIASQATQELPRGPGDTLRTSAMSTAQLPPAEVEAPPPARPRPPGPRRERPVTPRPEPPQRSRWPVRVGVAFAVVAVLASLAYLGRRRGDEAPPAPPVAEPTQLDAGPWPELEALVAGAAFRVAVRPRREAYRVGEDLIIDVEVPRDGHLNVLNIGRREDVVQVLFPNAFQRDNAVQSGQQVTIPAPEAPFALPADLPADEEQQETLIVVVHTTAPLSAFESAGGGGALGSLSAAQTRELIRAVAGSDAAGSYGAGEATVTIRR